MDGNINIKLGNSDALGGGNATFIAYAPAGSILYHSGNGPDLVDLIPQTDGQIWNVRVVFGSNDDLFELSSNDGSNTSATLSGYVSGGGNIVGNTFAQSSNWTLSPTLFVTNFP